MPNLKMPNLSKFIFTIASLVHLVVPLALGWTETLPALDHGHNPPATFSNELEGKMLRPAEVMRILPGGEGATVFRAYQEEGPTFLVSMENAPELLGDIYRFMEGLASPKMPGVIASFFIENGLTRLKGALDSWQRGEDKPCGASYWKAPPKGVCVGEWGMSRRGFRTASHDPRDFAWDPRVLTLQVVGYNPANQEIAVQSHVWGHTDLDLNHKFHNYLESLYPKKPLPLSVRFMPARPLRDEEVGPWLARKLYPRKPHLVEGVVKHIELALKERVVAQLLVSIGDSFQTPLGDELSTYFRTVSGLEDGETPPFHKSYVGLGREYPPRLPSLLSHMALTLQASPKKEKLWSSYFQKIQSFSKFTGINDSLPTKPKDWESLAACLVAINKRWVPHIPETLQLPISTNLPLETVGVSLNVSYTLKVINPFGPNPHLHRIEKVVLKINRDPMLFTGTQRYLDSLAYGLTGGAL